MDFLIAAAESAIYTHKEAAVPASITLPAKLSFPGYRIDYYEVFRSTKRYSGYTKKPFYTTNLDKKTTYTNTGSLQKGTRYYYKVRGVRTIDGEKCYTQWSNKAWRMY